MVNLHVNDVPDELYQRIRWLAAKRDSSIDSLILEVVEREIRWEEWHEDWETLPKLDSEIDSVALLRRPVKKTIGNWLNIGISENAKIGHDIDRFSLSRHCNGNHGCNQCGESVSRTSSTHLTQS